MKAAYTVFHARAGDHNDLAMPGAAAIGNALLGQTGIAPTTIGNFEPALNKGWREELEAAMPALRLMQDRLESVFAEGSASVAATSRCAVSLATLPVVIKHHPSACVVWFDAHADLNTPGSTTTGYLGGLVLAGAAGLWNSDLGAGLSLNSLILVGQRDLDPFEQELIEQFAIPHIRPTDDLPAALRQAISGRPIYIHLDCDVLEPGIVPTDYCHEGGLTLDDLLVCSQEIAEHRVVGIEIAEFQNAWDQSGGSVSPGPLLQAIDPILALFRSRT
ncbi:arginase family protein [Inquilinus sp. CAU 1745]|uniref:arginase family protein n=1 Tax=Inquilinus sp. CAU 1745 TaxID=3140369 RepID=UPI00325BC48A